MPQSRRDLLKAGLHSTFLAAAAPHAFGTAVGSPPPNVPAEPTQRPPRRAIAHDGTDLEFVVAGTGKRFLFLGPYAPTNPVGMKPWIDGLGQDFRLIFSEYPGEPKMYTLPPAAVARD